MKPWLAGMLGAFLIGATFIGGYIAGEHRERHEYHVPAGSRGWG